MTASETGRTTTLLTHVKVELALHELRPGTGRPLLLLHGLGERTSTHVPPAAEAWPGPVFGLDLTGHGGSSRAPGGGYTAEILMADVDTALAHLGPATIIGRPIALGSGCITSVASAFERSRTNFTATPGAKDLVDMNRSIRSSISAWSMVNAADDPTFNVAPSVVCESSSNGSHGITRW